MPIIERVGFHCTIISIISVFVECYWPELGLDVAFLIHSAGLSSVPLDIV